MQFYKMQALGNDFIVFGSPAKTTLPKSEKIRFLCNRHYGIGADCAVFIGNSGNADFFMHVFNPDGLEAEICGNALRCSAQYVSEKGFFRKKSFIAETRSGARSLKINQSNVTAEIGVPRVINKGWLDIEGISLPYTSVSLGNPHCVIFCSNLSNDDFYRLGPKLENHPLFPEGTNVEFAAVSSGNKIAMRVWERGIGETLSCSTGSCACVAAAMNEGICENNVEVHQPGGIIQVETKGCGNMFITGSCKTVFKGTIV